MKNDSFLGLKCPNKPFSNCTQFCQFPARFLHFESFAFCRIIRFFLVNTKRVECLRVVGVHAHWKHFVQARLSATGSGLSLQSRGSNMHQVIYFVSNETILNRKQWTNIKFIRKPICRLKERNMWKKQILNHIHIIITLIKIQMVMMHKLITKRKFQGEL